MLGRMGPLAVGAWVALALLTPAPVLACTPVPCPAGELVPGNGAVVPASLPAVEWIGRGFGSGSVTAVRIDGGAEVAVGVTLVDDLITFDAPLLAGANYVVRAHIECTPDAFGQDLESAFSVGPAVALPTDLGTLEVSDIGIGPVLAITYIGSCSLEVDASRTRVALELSSAASAWDDALLYETWVDGARWRPSGSLGGAVGPRSGSWIGRGVDVIYSHCLESMLVESEGLPEGAHVVEMRARVAGTDATLASPTAAFTLDCSSYVPYDGGVGYSGIDSGTRTDAGVVASADAGVDAGAEPTPSSACSARPGAQRGLSPLALVMLLGFASALGRRKS